MTKLLTLLTRALGYLGVRALRERAKRAEVRIELSDRYSAAGKPYPDPDTVCAGLCEGMGCFPLRREDAEARGLMGAWNAATPDDEPMSDWRFVKCAVCNGTGKRELPPLTGHEWPKEWN